MRLGCTHAQERSERYMGRIEEVLVEERNPKNAAQVKKKLGEPRFFSPNDWAWATHGTALKLQTTVLRSLKSGVLTCTDFV